ncbi:sugar phosphate isomerase [Cytophagales bacterium WSM2-2]|nr:sugar phosphate isomerase [Cytophagales bacterium WSM2-2]
MDKLSNNQTRREFLQTSAGLLAASLAGSAFVPKTPRYLSFSTLGCPDWTFKQIADFAARQYYQGLEIRGIKRQLDLTQCPEFSKTNIPSTLQLMRDNNLKFADLGSSATLHFSEPVERKKNIDEGKKFIDLAHELSCPNVRVFPNLFPKDQEKKATIDLIVKGLLELGEFAKGSDVNVLIESHGDLLSIADLEEVMKAATHPNVGMIWDVTNMWIKTHESPKAAYERLKTYIRHTHIKDAKMVGEKIVYTRLGQGKVPIFEAIDILLKDGYKGYYSFEWEKLWHPELEEPALAIAEYARVMKKHFKQFS